MNKWSSYGEGEMITIADDYYVYAAEGYWSIRYDHYSRGIVVDYDENTYDLTANKKAVLKELVKLLDAAASDARFVLNCEESK